MITFTEAAQHPQPQHSSEGGAGCNQPVPQRSVCWHHCSSEEGATSPSPRGACTGANRCMRNSYGNMLPGVMCSPLHWMTRTITLPLPDSLRISDFLSQSQNRPLLRIFMNSFLLPSKYFLSASCTDRIPLWNSTNFYDNLFFFP